MFHKQSNIFILIIAIAILAIVEVSSDCGCNKANRKEIKIDRKRRSENAETNDEPADICPSTGASSLKDLMHDEVIDANSIANMALIPGGIYRIGTDTPVFVEDRESPEREVAVDEFYLDLHEVSNRDFLAFVDATKYVTEAEQFGDSFVFEKQIDERTREKYKDYRVASAKWWYKVKGVDWKHPTGPESSIKGIADHPVVHVSYKDASEYCAWRNKRLPNEEEWEVACRGGKNGKLFPWGNKLMPKDEHW